MASKVPKFEVYARLREAESKAGTPISVSTDIVKQGSQEIGFKKVFAQDVPTSTVFDVALKHNVDKLLIGHNVQVVAYGGPGSGKSFSFIGNKDSPGVINKSLESIFSSIASNTKEKFLVMVSMYQVQTTFSSQRNKSREVIVDLINPDTSKTLALLEFRDSVEGIAEIVCRTTEQAQMFIRQGWAVHRALSQREAAPRGHVFVDIRVESMDRDDPSRITYGTLRFALLTSVAKRAQEYVLGLKELSNVVNARTSGTDDFQIAYSASKVTALLQNSLSGSRSNAVGVFLLTLMQNTDVVDQLELAGKIQALSVSSRANFNTITAAVRDLREEIKRRRDELKLDNPTTYLQDIKAENIQTLQRLIVELERVKGQTWRSKADNSAAVLRQRVARFKAEGLLGILAEGAPEVSPELKTAANEKLKIVMEKHNAVMEQESKVDAVRLRMSKLKMGDGKGNPDRAEKAKVIIEKLQENLKTGEKDLAKAIGVYNNALNDYIMAQKAVLLQEAKLSKGYLFSEDAAAVQRARDHETRAEMRAEREAYIKEGMDKVKTKASANTSAIEKADSADALKEVAIRLATELEAAEKRALELEVDKNVTTEALFKKDAAHEVQLQRFQEHMFFLFRNYRSHFEDQKARIEMRYRELVESSVKDALKLQEECTRLRADLLKRSGI